MSSERIMIKFKLLFNFGISKHRYLQNQHLYRYIEVSQESQLHFTSILASIFCLSDIYNKNSRVWGLASIFYQWKQLAAGKKNDEKYIVRLFLNGVRSLKRNISLVVQSNVRFLCIRTPPQALWQFNPGFSTEAIFFYTSIFRHFVHDLVTPHQRV